MGDVPNEVTIAAIKELEAGNGKRVATLAELMADLEAEDEKPGLWKYLSRSKRIWRTLPEDWWLHSATTVEEISQW